VYNPTLESRRDWIPTRWLLFITVQALVDGDLLHFPVRFVGGASVPPEQRQSMKNYLLARAPGFFFRAAGIPGLNSKRLR
jgi:hypothetical protein